MLPKVLVHHAGGRPAGHARSTAAGGSRSAVSGGARATSGARRPGDAVREGPPAAAVRVSVRVRVARGAASVQATAWLATGYRS